MMMYLKYTFITDYQSQTSTKTQGFEAGPLVENLIWSIHLSEYFNNEHTHT